MLLFPKNDRNSLKFMVIYERHIDRLTYGLTNGLTDKRLVKEPHSSLQTYKRNSFLQLQFRPGSTGCCRNNHGAGFRFDGSYQFIFLKYYMMVLVLGSFPAGLRYVRSAQPEKKGGWKLQVERLLAFHNSASNTTHSTIASQKPPHAYCTLYKMPLLHTVRHIIIMSSKFQGFFRKEHLMGTKVVGYGC